MLLGLMLLQLFAGERVAKVSLCLHHFKIYHTCQDIVAVKKKISRNPQNWLGRGITRETNTTKHGEHKKYHKYIKGI